MGYNNNFRNCQNSNFARDMRDIRNINCMPEPKDVCNFREDEDIDSLPIAMAYVPWQSWHSIYDLDKAFACGTIFAELNKPFTGRCM